MILQAPENMYPKFTLIQNDENCVAVARGTWKEDN